MPLIPAENLPRLIEEVEALNRRAVKLGVSELTLSVLGTETKPAWSKLGVPYTERYVEVSLTGEPPCLNGWTLVAVLETLPNGEVGIRTVPGETLPMAYRMADPSHCDHCETNRRRSETFVVRHDDGTHKQVGRQCLADFLGRGTAEQLIQKAEIGWLSGSLVSDAEEDGWGAGRGERHVDTEHFLSVTSICIRRMGWMSRTDARDTGQATADNAWLIVTMPNHPQARYLIEEFNLRFEDRDRDLAQTALAWARSLPKDGSDYEFNLGAACRCDVVGAKQIGIVASAISAYRRYQEQAIKRGQGVHVRTVGERRGFPGLTVESMRHFESAYGVRTLIRFRDAEGNVLVWWASGSQDDYTEGATVDVTGTVKAHEEYKGEKQTQLSRCTLGLSKNKARRKNG